MPLHTPPLLTIKHSCMKIILLALSKMLVPFLPAADDVFNARETIAIEAAACEVSSDDLVSLFVTEVHHAYNSLGTIDKSLVDEHTDAFTTDLATVEGTHFRPISQAGFVNYLFMLKVIDVLAPGCPMLSNTSLRLFMPFLKCLLNTAPRPVCTSPTGLACATMCSCPISSSNPSSSFQRDRP